MRRRHARNLVRTLSHDERETASSWLFQSWFYGQRNASGYRSAGCLSRPPGHLALGRWRFLDAHGGCNHPETTELAGEGDHLHELNTWLWGAGAEGRRLARVCN